MSHEDRTPEKHEHADDWHHHSADEGLPQAEHAATVDPRSLMITFIGIVFGVVFLILLVMVYFNNYVSTNRAQKQEGIPAVRAEYVADRAAAQTRLSEYGHIDRDAGVIHVPLNVATERVIEDYEANGSAAVTREPAGDELANGG